MAESLLPYTDAITRETLEWEPYRGKHLVRYKDRENVVHRTLTADWEEANAAFEKYLADMKARAQRRF